MKLSYHMLSQFNLLLHHQLPSYPLLLMWQWICLIRLKLKLVIKATRLGCWKNSLLCTMNITVPKWDECTDCTEQYQEYIKKKKNSYNTNEYSRATITCLASCKQVFQTCSFGTHFNVYNSHTLVKNHLHILVARVNVYICIYSTVKTLTYH